MRDPITGCMEASGAAAVDLQAALAQPCFNANYIGGQWVEASSADTYETISPTTETPVHRTCPASTSTDVEAAVAAARDAADAGYDEWGGLSATDRVQYLLALSTKLEEHAAFIAELEVRDVGKPVVDAHGDITRCISEIEECVALAAQLDAMQDTVVYQSADVLGQRRWDPVGVVACITPWNFPLLVTIMKLAPALTAGNTVVLKPSEYSPLTTMFAARLCDEVGFPAGVVNVISGTGSACGAPLSQSQGIDMVSFTGSVPTGSAIMGEAAKNIVKPLLELGGKSPSIVFDDVDLDTALPWVMSGFLSNTGAIGSHFSLKVHVFKSSLIQQDRCVSPRQDSLCMRAAKKSCSAASFQSWSKSSTLLIHWMLTPSGWRESGIGRLDPSSTGPS